MKATRKSTDTVVISVTPSRAALIAEIDKLPPAAFHYAAIAVETISTVDRDDFESAFMGEISHRHPRYINRAVRGLCSVEYAAAAGRR